MEVKLTGKKALVTGAAQGIGRAIVEKLSLLGANVCALDTDFAQLESLKLNVPNVTPICSNLLDLNQTKLAITPHLPFDLLVNNAGITILEDFVDVTSEAFDKVIGVNLKATLFVSQTIVKSMLEHGIKGSIVHISSQASKVPLKQHTVYMASKAAVDSMAKSMALELSPRGIRINCVNPTVVMTAMGRKAWSDPAKAQPMLARISMGRFAEIEDVVNSVMWLLSDFSGMTTGATLPVEGGVWAT